MSRARYAHVFHTLWWLYNYSHSYLEFYFDSIPDLLRINILEFLYVPESIHDLPTEGIVESWWLSRFTFQVSTSHHIVDAITVV